MQVLGIDVGGSGIKGTIVETDTGEVLFEHIRIPTPEGAKPDDMANVIKDIVNHFEWKGIAGCGFPTLIINGVCQTAANVDSSWIGINVGEMLTAKTGCKFYVLNDADAAGLAEIEMGAGKGNEKGTVLMITLGTGIGSAIFLNGKLLPNTELGHIEIRGKDAERRASAAVKTRKGLNYQEWAVRVQEYLKTLENLIPADLIIIGGGVSKKSERFFPYLELRAKIVPARFTNQAGIIGSAIFAAQQESASG